MEEREGKKMPEPYKSLTESKPQKLFIQLPPNYLELPPEEQEEWRKQLAETILEQHRKPSY
ncbi:hypothetical protein N9A11_01010 [bacterium]|nr:hypothetical protein [bacterium]